MSAGLILVVDDHPVNLELLLHLLTGHGYEVMTAADAPAAQAAIRLRRPGLILMDLQLPGMDGFELTRRLKADPATAAIPVIAVTSYAMSVDKLSAMQAGCDAYVTKPIDTRTLPALIARFMAARPPA